jgi:D-alanyl-D-alanine carboxypeptidase
VQPGDTLASIAIDQGTAASTLVSLNGIPRNAELTPGQVLLIMDSPPGELPCGDILVPANRQHALGEFCAPSALSTLASQYVVTAPQRLTPEAASALVQMLDDARDAGFDLYVSSSYRSWQEQEALFQYWVDLLGLERASRESARAGYSEHQLGTTADITSPSVNWQLDPSFADTPEGAWLAEHAADYGFVMSYPEDGEPVTGYIYEPWHFRYVGTEIAREVEESGKTLIEVLMYHWALDHGSGG